MKCGISYTVRCAILIGLISDQTSFAQSGPVRSAENTPSGSEQSQVEEIIVTAQKRSQNIQVVPIAMSTIGAEALDAGGATNTLDLGRFVPGLVIGKTGQALQTYLRGVGQGSGVPGAESPVATYLDGIYLGSTALGVFDLNNIDQVAVLKGPQGTLFGRNATGGLIQITTRDPSQTAGGKADIGFANYDTVSGDLYVTGPVTANLSANLALVGKDAGDGYVRNVHTGHDIVNEKSYSAQTKFLWQPDSGPDVTLNLIHGSYRNLPGSALGVPPGYLSADGITPHLGARTVSNRTDDPNQSGSTIGSVRITDDLGWARLTNLVSGIEYTSYLQADQSANAGLPNPNNTRAQLVTWTSGVHTETEEFQLQAPADQDFQWITGFFYLHDVTKFNLAVTQDAVPAATVDTRVATDSYSGFAQATKTILPDTRLTAGLRYVSDTRSFGGVTNTGLTPQAAGTPTEKTWPRLVWRFALDHSFTPDILGYVSYDRGFKSGAYSNSLVTNPPAAPEIVDAYEIGVKSELLGKRLRLNLAGFYYDYRNIQLRALQGASLNVYNAASSRIYGLDVDLDAVLTDRLTLTGGAEVLDAKYTDFPNGVENLPTPLATIPGGCTGTPNPRRGGTTPIVCDLTGNTMIQSPKFTANLGIQYDWEGTWGDLTLDVADHYNSGYYFEPDNQLHQNAYHWLTASLRWTSPDGYWTAKLWGTNLISAKVFLSEVTAASTYAFIPGEPAMYGATVGVKF